MRLSIRGLKPENQEFIETRRGALTQSGNCILGLLNGIFILPPIGREGSIPFIRRVLLREIHTHDSNADCLSAPFLEFFSLPCQIANYAVNLLNHCFSQYLRLHSDLNRCDRGASHREPLIRNSSGNRNAFTKRAVTSPSRNANCEILCVQHTAARVNTFAEICGYS